MRLLSEDVTTPALQPYLLPLEEIVDVPDVDTTLTGAALVASQKAHDDAIAKNKAIEERNAPIIQATQLVEAHCGRVFAKQSYLSRVYVERGDACNEIDIVQRPIDRASVVITDAAGVPVSSDNYVIGNNTLIPTSAWSSGVLSIAYDAGFDEIPEIVVRACRNLIDKLARLDKYGVDYQPYPAPFEYEHSPSTGEGVAGMKNVKTDVSYQQRVAFYRENPTHRLISPLVMSWLDPYVIRRLV